MLYEKITQRELDLMKREDGTSPNYTYEDYIINRNKETGEIVEEYYTNLTIHMTADEAYEKWLTDKDKIPEPNQIEILEEENRLLKERIDATENALLELMIKYSSN